MSRKETKEKRVDEKGDKMIMGSKKRGRRRIKRKICLRKECKRRRRRKKGTFKGRVQEEEENVR